MILLYLGRTASLEGCLGALWSFDSRANRPGQSCLGLNTGVKNASESDSEVIRDEENRKYEALQLRSTGTGTSGKKSLMWSVTSL